MIPVSFLTSIFFLGGWLEPFHGWDIPLLSVDGWWWLLAEGVLLRQRFIWFRASFPRYRYDQIMRLGWKGLHPGHHRVDLRDRADGVQRHPSGGAVSA